MAIFSLLECSDSDDDDDSDDSENDEDESEQEEDEEKPDEASKEEKPAGAATKKKPESLEDILATRVLTSEEFEAIRKRQAQKQVSPPTSLSRLLICLQ